MPEVETYKFSHKEILTLMVKDAGLHEGKWQLLMNFGFNAGNFGPDGNNSSPGAITVVNHLMLGVAKEDSPSALVVDAAEVNPKPTA